MTHAVRKSERSVVSRNVETALRSFEVTPRYPAVRDVWGETKLSTTFSHLDPDKPGWQIRGQRILFLTAVNLDELGAIKLQNNKDVNHGTELVFRSNGIINYSYDNSLPVKPKEMIVDYPGYDRIAIGEFPTILLGDVPYSRQEIGVKPINFARLREQTVNDFGSAPEVAKRVEEVVWLFRKSLHTKHKTTKPAVPAILELRSNIMKKLGIEHVEEAPFTAYLDQVAESLRVLQREYKKPFYEMPLRSEFAPAGHLKGVDSTGERRPVKIEYASGLPVFSFTDSQTYEAVTIKGDDIYDALRNGTVMPTVPTIILAVSTAPQIAHMGGQSWLRYAPPEIRHQAEWLGITREDADKLFLTTMGYNPFVVKYAKKGELRNSPNFSMGYVTFGREEIVRALETDTCIVGEYGNHLKLEVRH